MSAGIGNLGMGATSTPQASTPGGSDALLSSLGLSDFDPAWYLQKYPEVAAAQLNPIYHYLAYGEREGRMKNANDTGTSDSVKQAASSASNPTPLDPTNPASMAAWRQQAHDQTNQINSLKGVLSPAGLAVQSSQPQGLTPQAAAALIQRYGLPGATIGGVTPQTGATDNLGMGAMNGTPNLQALLQQYNGGIGAFGGGAN